MAAALVSYQMFTYLPPRHSDTFRGLDHCQARGAVVSLLHLTCCLVASTEFQCIIPLRHEGSSHGSCKLIDTKRLSADSKVKRRAKFRACCIDERNQLHTVMLLSQSSSTHASTTMIKNTVIVITNIIKGTITPFRSRA